MSGESESVRLSEFFSDEIHHLPEGELDVTSDEKKEQLSFKVRYTIDQQPKQETITGEWVNEASGIRALKAQLSSQGATDIEITLTR